jgi:hypothetical protein
VGVYKKYTSVASRTIYKDGVVTPEDYVQFRADLASLPVDVATYWGNLLSQDPLIRFKCNMDRIMGCVLFHPVVTVIPDGVNSKEVSMLGALDRLSVPSRAVGHELLNLRERQNFVDWFRPVLNAYRCQQGGNV